MMEERWPARSRLSLGLVFIYLAVGLLFGNTGCGRTPPAPATPWVPHSTEGNLTKVAVRILEETQYAHRPFDDALSVRFLDRYVDTLDGQHQELTQADLQEFAIYRTTLDDLSRAGDARPAPRIYARFLERLEQHTAYVAELLKAEKFEFNRDEPFAPDRHDLPRPADVEQARQLWRQQLRYEFLQEKLTDKRPDEIVQTLRRRHTSLLRVARELEPAQILELYLTALASTYDPHTDYLGSAQFENFGISMKLSLVGIGAELVAEDGYCTIRRILPGPAARSRQLKPGDRIVAVAQTGQSPIDVVNMPLPKAVELIRGPKGSKVHLTVIPVDAAGPTVRKKVSLVRDEIRLEDQEAKAQLIEVPTGNGSSVLLGVIDLPSFYEDMDRLHGPGRKSTTEDVALLLRKLKREKVRGIILDLRQNGGGSLWEAIDLTGLFIAKGPVVQVRDVRGKVTVYADTDRTVQYDGPLLVLTSRFSASASEILAGALQDYGRALIVGDSSTFGKGTVQSVMELNGLMKQLRLGYRYDPGAMVVTIQKFYRPGGASTQLKGVIPDLVLPSLSNLAEVGESALHYPLPWDQIRPAKFQFLNRVQPYLPELKRRSTRRIESDPDFVLLREEIDTFRKSLAEKTVSLSEEKRRRENDEDAARLTARLRNRPGAGKTRERIYEITLRNAALPGLPPALVRSNAGPFHETSPLPPDEDQILPRSGPGRGLGADSALAEAQRILQDYLSLLK